MDVHISLTTCVSINASNPNNNNNDMIHNNMIATNPPLSDQNLLHCLNDEKAWLYLPVIVFLAVLVLVGSLGNALVLCVYWRKAYKASSHYFILSLAALDLFTCLVGLPTEIADLRFPYMFNLPIACKLLRFTHSSTIIASSIILIQFCALCLLVVVDDGGDNDNVSGGVVAVFCFCFPAAEVHPF